MTKQDKENQKPNVLNTPLEYTNIKDRRLRHIGSWTGLVDLNCDLSDVVEFDENYRETGSSRNFASLKYVSDGKSVANFSKEWKNFEAQKHNWTLRKPPTIKSNLVNKSQQMPKLPSSRSTPCLPKLSKTNPMNTNNRAEEAKLPHVSLKSRAGGTSSEMLP